MFSRAKTIVELGAGQDDALFFVKKVRNDVEGKADVANIKKGQVLAVFKRTTPISEGFGARSIFVAADVDGENIVVDLNAVLAEAPRQYKLVKNPTRIARSDIRRYMLEASDTFWPFKTIKARKEEAKRLAEEQEEREYQEAKAKHAQEKADKRHDLFKRIREEIHHELTTHLAELAEKSNPKALELINNLIEAKCQEFYQLAVAEIDDKIKENNETFFKLINKTFARKSKDSKIVAQAKKARK